MIPALRKMLVSGLFAELVDQMASPADCDHTLRRSEAWAAAQDVEWPALRATLHRLGAHCDCEVILNIAVPAWENER